MKHQDTKNTKKEREDERQNRPMSAKSLHRAFKLSGFVLFVSSCLVPPSGSIVGEDKLPRVAVLATEVRRDHH